MRGSPSAKPERPQRATAAPKGKSVAAGEASHPLFNRSVEKAFAVLAAFDGERRALGLAQIAAQTGMTAGSAQRCIHTLVQLGYLRRDDSSRGWALTPRTLSLGLPYLAGHPFIEQSTPHLVELNHQCEESVSLSEPDGTEMVFIARFASVKRFFIHMPVGRRLPMYCTASGRAYLSALPRGDAVHLLRQSTLRKFTPHTLTDVDAIMRIVDEARERGYAWANQECYLGDLTIASPVRGEGGRPLGSVNVSGPTSRWTLDELKDQVAPVLLQTAAAATGSVAAFPAA